MRPLILVVLLAACGGPVRQPPLRKPAPAAPAGCTPQDCEGCCLDGVCIHSPTPALCGGGGQACFACPDGQVCGFGRTCETPAAAKPLEANACTLVLVPLRVQAARAFTAVWASAQASWAVGPQGAGVLEGDTFVPPANDAAIGVGLRAVWASGDDAHTVWIIRQGTDAAIHREIAGLGLDEPSPLHGEIFAVWGRGENDVYVGGDDGEIARWNGHQWTLAQVASERIIALAGWGRLGAFALTATELLMEQNGRFVSMGQAPVRLGPALFPAGEREVWAGDERGNLRRWIDGSWEAYSVATGPLTSVWAQSSKAIFVPRSGGGMALFDGHHVIPLPLDGRQLVAMHGVPTRAVAVGDGAMLARCAQPGEIPDGHVVSGTTYSGDGYQGEPTVCVTSCVYDPHWGCISTSTHCY